MDRCLSRTRNLAVSSEHLAEFFSGRSWPKIGPGIIFFGAFEKFETVFSKICAHSERYRNILVGIFEIQTFYGNIAFSLSPVFYSSIAVYSSSTAVQQFFFFRALVHTWSDGVRPTQGLIIVSRVHRRDTARSLDSG